MLKVKTAYYYLFRVPFSFKLICFILLQVLDEYVRNGEQFLKKVFTNGKYLEEITALSQYQLIDDDLEVKILTNCVFLIRFCFM